MKLKLSYKNTLIRPCGVSRNVGMHLRYMYIQNNRDKFSLPKLLQTWLLACKTSKKEETDLQLTTLDMRDSPKK